MRVEVLQARHPLGHKSVGDIIPEMPEGVANGLIARGIVRAMAAPGNRMLVAERPRASQVKKGH